MTELVVVLPPIIDVWEKVKEAECVPVDELPVVLLLAVVDDFAVVLIKDFVIVCKTLVFWFVLGNVNETRLFWRERLVSLVAEVSDESVLEGSSSVLVVVVSSSVVSDSSAESVLEGSSSVVVVVVSLSVVSDLSEDSVLVDSSLMVEVPVSSSLSVEAVDSFLVLDGVGVVEAVNFVLGGSFPVNVTSLHVAVLRTDVKPFVAFWPGGRG